MAKSNLLGNIKILIVIVGLVAVAIEASTVLPVRSDWALVYRPAANLLVSGQSPYAVPNYVAPPWILLPLLPIAILPERIGRVIIFLASIISYAYIARKCGANLFSLVFIIVSYPVVYGLIYGQIDWLVMLGLIAPPWLAVVLLMAKPQVGIGVIVFLAYEAWKVGKARKLIILFVPFVSLLAISLAVYGIDVLTKFRLVLTPTNTSLWPRSIPIGLVILLGALKKKEKGQAMVASPFLSPYMPVHSWAAAIIGLAGNSLYTIVVAIASWLVWILGGGAVNG